MNHPIDIAWALSVLTGRKHDEKQLEDAMYNLQAIAGNPLNAEYWRTLYKALSSIADVPGLEGLPF